MEEKETTEVDDIQSQIDSKLAIVNTAEELSKMMELPVYKNLIDGLFLKAYRETSAYNVAIMNEEQKAGYMYQITARSIFERFIDEVLLDGAESAQQLASLNEELKDAKLRAETVEN